jgi:hypothetical protein
VDFASRPPRAASVPGRVRRWLLDLPFEDPRQVPILATDLCHAGARRVSGTLGLAVRDRVTAKLATLRVPALLGRGSRDRIAPQSWLDHLATLIPDAEMLVLHGAAHNAVPTAGRNSPSSPTASSTTGEGARRLALGFEGQSTDVQSTQRTDESRLPAFARPRLTM